MRCPKCASREDKHEVTTDMDLYQVVMCLVCKQVFVKMKYPSDDQ